MCVFTNGFSKYKITESLNEVLLSGSVGPALLSQVMFIFGSYFSTAACFSAFCSTTTPVVCKLVAYVCLSPWPMCCRVLPAGGIWSPSQHPFALASGPQRYRVWPRGSATQKVSGWCMGRDRTAGTGVVKPGALGGSHALQST